MTASVVLHADAFEMLPALAVTGEPFHGIVTDPPYGLGSWDWIKDQNKLHAWHREWAEKALNVVYPGAHMAVFSGTRHFHHMMLAIEDAGWELRDTLLWLKAGGMPKSRNRGAFGTGLKPAWEPIALFRKPLEGTIFDNFDKYETGMLHIDATRIATADKLGGGNETEQARVHGEHFMRPWMNDPEALKRHAATIRDNVKKAEELGRWPANVVLDANAAEELDLQTGILKSGKGGKVNKSAGKKGTAFGAKGRAGEELVTHGDEGGASRFFFCAKASPSERDAGLPEGMKNKHPTVKPIKLMQWLNRLLIVPGGRILDPFAGSGSTGCAAVPDGFTFTGIEAAGSLDGGRKVWILAHMAEDMQIAGEDIYRYVLFTNAHDGRGSVSASMTDVRVVCQNTLVWALQGAKANNRIHRVRHTTKAVARLAEAKAILGLRDLRSEELARQGEWLVGQTMSDKQFDKFLEKLMPIPEEQGDKPAGTMMRERRSRVRTLYREADNLNNIRGTKWGALNAAVEYSDYARGFHDDATQTKAQFGLTSTTIKDTAIGLLLDGAPQKVVAPA